MFDPPVRVLANRSVELMFDTARVDAGATRSELPEAKTDLNFSYEYNGVTHPATDIVEDTFTDGLLIIKRGRIVHEGYFNHANEQTHFISMSMAKSINAILVGMALREGLIQSVLDPITRYIPELKGSGYDGTTLRDLLEMRSGVDWNDNFLTPGYSNYDAHRAAWVLAQARYTDFAQKTKRKYEPGTVYYYNSMNAAVVGLAVERAVKMPISRYLSERLWKPSGMQSYSFYLLDGPPGAGREFSAGGFNAVLRDYGRIGLLMLNQGRANGTQLLPPAYFTEMVTPSTSDSETGHAGLGYSYFWWPVLNTRAFTALGGEGQFIYVDPATETVIIKMSHGPTGPAFKPVYLETISFLKAASAWDGGIKSIGAEPTVRSGASNSVPAKPSPDRMTRERYAEYLKLFNSRDDHYAEYYDPNIVFDHGTYGILRGRQAVLDLYHRIWSDVDEEVVPGKIAIDNENGNMLVELTTPLRAKHDDVKLAATREFEKQGDLFTSRVVVAYGLADGLITTIKGVGLGTSYEPAARLAPFPKTAAELTPKVNAQIETAYRQYLDCFNRQDFECFTNFFADDMVYESTTWSLHGKAEFKAFYIDAWKHFREHLSINSIELRPNQLVVNVSNNMDVFADYPEFAGGPRMKGDRYLLKGTVIYTLENGRIARIEVPGGGTRVKVKAKN